LIAAFERIKSAALRREIVSFVKTIGSSREVAAHCRKMAAAEEAATNVSSIRRPVARA
jgi:hypothetical protein